MSPRHANRAYHLHPCFSSATKVCSFRSRAQNLAARRQADFSHHLQGSFPPLISDRDLFFLVNSIFVFTHVTRGHCRSYGREKRAEIRVKTAPPSRPAGPTGPPGGNNRSPRSSEGAPSASRPPGAECGPREPPAPRKQPGGEGGPRGQFLSCPCRCVAMMMKGLEPRNIKDFYLTGRKVRTSPDRAGSTRGACESTQTLGVHTPGPAPQKNLPKGTNMRVKCFVSPSERV